MNGMMHFFGVHDMRGCGTAFFPLFGALLTNFSWAVYWMDIPLQNFKWILNSLFLSRWINMSPMLFYPSISNFHGERERDLTFSFWVLSDEKI